MTQVARKKNSASTPNRSGTYGLLLSSPDTLPLSHMRLVGAKATKLHSCDKHPHNQTLPTLEMTPGFKTFTSCILLVVECRYVLMRMRNE